MKHLLERLWSPHRDSSPPRSRGLYTRRIRLEPLEDRRLLATFVVLNTNNFGAGSLRQAILDANARTGTDTIAFNTPATDPNFVDVDSSLPGEIRSRTHILFGQPSRRFLCSGRLPRRAMR